MAAPTETYVDPSIAGDSGAGTIGDPFGDLQFALNSVTRDATNGDRFNIKAGTDEIMGAAIDLTSYGTPAAGAPLIFQGYTSAAGDGGQGGISGGGSVSISTSVLNYIVYRDLHLHNCGAADILDGIDFGIVEGCELDNTMGNGIDPGNSMLIIGNHFHNIGGFGVDSGKFAGIVNNYFKDETNKFTRAINSFSDSSYIARNIISLNSTTGYGIVAAGIVIGNSIFNAAAGTNIGIWGVTGVLSQPSAFLNNLIEGFSGAGGDGMQIDVGTDILLVGNNALYNNTTHYTLNDAISIGDNEELGASPFAKSGADTFANRFTYFAPVDTGNVIGGAYPSGANLDKGAVQAAAAGGGIRLAGRGGLAA
ncbi:MAG TPA: hypothetical protein VGA50_04570 [Kiloniellales bacterium]